MLPPAPEPPLIRVRLDVPARLILKVVAVVALFLLQPLTVVIIGIFVALLIGAQLLGTVGAFLALPIAAALPNIEVLARSAAEPAPPSAPAAILDPEEAKPAVTPAGYRPRSSG